MADPMTTTDTPESVAARLDAITVRWSRTTDGPWVYRFHDGNDDGPHFVSTFHGKSRRRERVYITGPIRQGDAEAIADAKQDVPWLVDLARAQAAEITRLRVEGQAMREALKKPGILVFLEGRNEDGAHVLPGWPATFDWLSDDPAEEAEIITAAAEKAGYPVGSHVWCEFCRIKGQYDGEGRCELPPHFEFVRVDPEMTRLIGYHPKDEPALSTGATTPSQEAAASAAVFEDRTGNTPICPACGNDQHDDWWHCLSGNEKLLCGNLECACGSIFSITSHTPGRWTSHLPHAQQADSEGGGHAAA